MSGGLAILQPSEDDMSKLVMAKCHLGTKNLDFQMKKYVYKRRADGVHIINLHKTWEKLVLAARIVAAVADPTDVCVISGPAYGQRAILKFSKFVGATAVAGRFGPGTFTNQIQPNFREPRVLIVTDPRVDFLPLREASYANIPIIALCNTDSPLRYVDVAIPCNNKSEHTVGLIWWLLAREVLRLRGEISREVPWSVMVDLFFYRKPEEIEAQEKKDEATEAEGGQASQWDTAAADANVGMSAQPVDWAASVDAPMPAVQPVGTANFGSVAPVGEDWGASAGGDQWGASAEWGNS